MTFDADIPRSVSHSDRIQQQATRSGTVRADTTGVADLVVGGRVGNEAVPAATNSPHAKCVGKGVDVRCKYLLVAPVGQQISLDAGSN